VGIIFKKVKGKIPKTSFVYFVAEKRNTMSISVIELSSQELNLEHWNPINDYNIVMKI
jgi:hypothetical protein